MYTHLKYLSFILIWMLTSCDKDSNTIFSEPQNENDYYVRYEATVTTGGLPYQYIEIYYNVTTEKGIQKFVSTERTFNQTFGPLKKGFATEISVDASNVPNSSCNVKIYVSRANEPFALKATNIAERAVNTSYIIDY